LDKEKGKYPVPMRTISLVFSIGEKIKMPWRGLFGLFEAAGSIGATPFIQSPCGKSPTVRRSNGNKKAQICRVELGKRNPKVPL
jgi:hypothetical protein